MRELLSNFPREMWNKILDKIKPYVMDELDMRILHPDVDIEGTQREERIISRDSEDFKKLQEHKEKSHEQLMRDIGRRNQGGMINYNTGGIVSLNHLTRRL